MIRTTKLLSATTALVAFAAASAHADAVTSNNLLPLYTSQSTTGFQIGSGVTVSSSAGAAIIISDSSATKNTITVGTGAVVSNSHATAAAIQAAATGTATNDGNTVIDVSGTVRANGASGKAIDLSNLAGTATGTVTMSGTISGSVTGSGQNDTFNIRGGTLTGALIGGGGTDTLNVSATNFTMTGGMSAVENLNVTAGIFNIDSAVNNTPATAVSAGATLGVKQNTTLGALTLASGANGGKLSIDGDTTLNATTLTANTGSQLLITVDNSSSAGKLNISGGVAAVGNTSLSVLLGSNSGYIASGTTYSIIADTGADSSVPNLLTTQNGLYTFSVAREGINNDVSLTIRRAATASVVTSEAGDAIATQLDTIGATINSGDIRTIQGLITSAGSAAQVNNIVESLTPATDTGSVLAGVNVGVQAGNNISNRLASLRSTGVATGDAGANNHMWVQGFGAVGDQDDKDGNRGYDMNTAGASFGVDTDTILAGSNLGAAFSYASSNVDSKASNNATTGIDSYIASLYGSRVYDQGYFLNGQASVGFHQNETERQVIGFATKTKGEYDSMQYSAKGELGRDIAYGSAVITPLASLQYTYANPDAYTETGPAALRVDGEGFSALDAGLGATVGWVLPMSSGGSVKPEVRANYIYRMGDSQAETTSRFVAGGTAFNTNGVEADRSAVNLGAGITLASGGGADLSLDYDADIRDSYTGHTGQVKLRWAF